MSTTFFDDFNRANGLPDNGWMESLDNQASLVINNSALTTSEIGSFEGIYRPIDMSGSVTASADITEKNGFGGLLNAYDTAFLFGGDGHSLSGYGVHIGRSDQNYANSEVDVEYNGVTLTRVASTFQYGAKVHLTVTWKTDGSIVGEVSGDGQTFDFQFDAHAVVYAGSDFEIRQSPPDPRSSVLTYPTIDNVQVVDRPAIIISNLADLQNIKDLSANYVLTGNIDASGFTFTPIGDSQHPFTGTLDGNGFTISHLKLTASAANNSWGHTGLFGVIGTTGVVKNFTLANASVTGGDAYVGVLAGVNNGSIENVSASVSINVSSGWVGGLVGYNLGSIFQSSTTGSVIDTNSPYNMPIVGGLVGYNLGSIEQSFWIASADVTSSQFVPALVGYNEGFQQGTGLIENSYALGPITAQGIDSWYNQGTSALVVASYATGNNGLVGINYQGGSVHDAYWVTTGGQTEGDGGIPITAGEIQANGLPSGLSSTIWGINPNVNGGLPYLLWQNIPAAPPESAVHLDLPFGTNVTYGGTVGPHHAVSFGGIPGTFIAQDFGQGYVDPTHYDHGSTKTSIDEDLYYSIDFSLDLKTPVLAQSTGEIISVVDDISDFDTALASDGSTHADHGFGNYVTIRYDLPNGHHLYATYMHLEKFSSAQAHLDVGEQVSEGDIIGYVGMSGATTGPHLHVTYGVQELPQNLGKSNPAYAQNASYDDIYIADGRYADNPQDGSEVAPINGPVFFNNVAADSEHLTFVGKPSLTSGHLKYGQTLVPTVTFSDDFNRPDGVPGNGWLETNPGELFIRNDVLTTATSGGGAIYRPIDMSDAVTFSADITQENGFGGLLRRYDTRIYFGNAGDETSGIGISINRGDQNYSDSRVMLIYNGADIDSLPSSFQFGSSISVSVAYASDGGISGTITGDGNTFDFSFASIHPTLPGSNLSIVQGSGDTRSGILTEPTIDNVKITQAAPTSKLSIVALDADKNDSENGPTAYTFTVTRTGDTTSITTVQWASGANQDPAATGADFVGGQFPSGTLTFEAGETSKVLSVEIAPHTLPQNGGRPQNFVVTLSKPSAGSIVDAAKASAEGHIHDGALLPFMAELAQAAYHLVTGEVEATGFNNAGGVLADTLFASLAASDALYDALPASLQNTSQLFHFLTSADAHLSSLSPVSINNTHFPTRGLVNGVYLDGNAAALVGQEGSSLFVSFRGTNDSSGSLLANLAKGRFGQASPDINDWFQMEQQYDKFNALLTALDQYIADPNSGVDHVYVTGHSLGAAMVQRYMMDHQEDSRFEAVTFADPGFAEQIISSKPLPKGASPEIINVHIDGDPILLPQQFSWAANLAGYKVGQAGDEVKLTHVTDATGDLHDMGLYYQAAISLDQNFKIGLDNFDQSENESDVQSAQPYEVLGDNGQVSISYAWSSKGMTVSLADPKLGSGLLAGDVYGSLFFSGIIGSSFDDTLTGSFENDTLQGGPGNDTIDGGGGINTAVYSGRPQDYLWHKNKDGSWTIRDISGPLSSVGPDGTDTLNNIQFLKFKGGTLAIDNGFAIDGYISGATVFSDDNGNGQLDPGEAATTTDGTGSFSIPPGTGPLIAFGGTDVSTGLPFNGSLSAPAGSSVITPLTTLVTDLSLDPSAQSKILAALGLSSSIDLANFDPVAAAQGGDADGAGTTIAGAKVYDTAEIIASALAGAGASFDQSLQDAFAALVAAFDSAGLDLGDKASLIALIAHVASTEGLTLPDGAADSIAQVIAAGNQALDHVLQTETPGASLLSDAAGVELVMEGAASKAVADAAGGTTKLDAVADLFTGANLSDLIAHAQDQVQNQDQDLGPVAFDGSATTDQNTILNGTVSAIDLEGKTINFAVEGPSPAGLVFKSDGTFSFDPGSTYKYLAVGESANLAFQFKASEGQGAGSTAIETIKIVGLNDNPVAAPDTNTLVVGTSVSISASKGVLTNDSDPDVNDHLLVSAVNGTAANVGNLVSGTYGSLKLNADGSYVYTSERPADAQARDVFTYSVSDGHGGSATSTLSISAIPPNIGGYVQSNEPAEVGNVLPPTYNDAGGSAALLDLLSAQLLASQNAFHLA